MLISFLLSKNEKQKKQFSYRTICAYKFIKNNKYIAHSWEYMSMNWKKKKYEKKWIKRVQL